MIKQEKKKNRRVVIIMTKTTMVTAMTFFLNTNKKTYIKTEHTHRSIQTKQAKTVDTK